VACPKAKIADRRRMNFKLRMAHLATCMRCPADKLSRRQLGDTSPARAADARANGDNPPLYNEAEAESVRQIFQRYLG
jgi:hypothetical protein